MNRPRIRKILLASVIVLALFDVLFKFTAPYRMSRKFVTQASKQLNGSLLAENEKFTGIRVRRFQFDAPIDAYNISYDLFTKNLSTGGVFSKRRACTIYGDGAIYRNDCPANQDISASGPGFFKIRIKR